MPVATTRRAWVKAMSRGIVAALVLLVVTPASAPALARVQSTRVAAATAHRSGRFLGIVPRRGDAGAASAAAAARRAVAQPPLTYHGGPVQHSSRVFAIFWIPPG